MQSGAIPNLCTYIRNSQLYLLLIIQFSFIKHVQNPLSHSDTLQIIQHFSGRRHIANIIHLKISQAGSNCQDLHYKLCYRTIQIGTCVKRVQKCDLKQTVLYNNHSRVRNFLLKYTLRKTFHMSEHEERINKLCCITKH